MPPDHVILAAITETTILVPYLYVVNNQAPLTHWGLVTYICVGNLTIIGSDNGLLPDQRQAIIWTNAGISLIGPNSIGIIIEIHTFSFKKKCIWKCHLENGSHFVSALMC